MTIVAGERCSSIAETLAEPMAGTVDERTRWLLVEDRSAWDTEAVANVLGADRADRAKRIGLRLLLVRRRVDPGHEPRAFLIDTVTHEMAAASVGSIADRSADDLATMSFGDFGMSFEGPLFLVCTNGRRDACCALRGRALLGALAAHESRILESTHLGGHRFAANLVCLPDGIVYGRVASGDGPRLVDAYLAGRLDPALMRGRSAWPAPAQVAEIDLRRRLGLDGVDDIALVSVDGDAERATVTVRAAGVEHTVELVAELGDPRRISCRSEETERPLHWRALRAG